MSPAARSDIDGTTGARVARVAHKYSKLLIICITVLATGCTAFWVAILASQKR
jgi:hypothetical protein